MRHTVSGSGIWFEVRVLSERLLAVHICSGYWLQATLADAAVLRLLGCLAQSGAQRDALIWGGERGD